MRSTTTCLPATALLLASLVACSSDDDAGGPDAAPVDAASTIDAGPDASGVNQAPELAASITGPASLIAGNSGMFTIRATDPDGDPLTYTWTQTAPAQAGTFVVADAATGQWRSPVIGAATMFTLQVSVSDGRNPAVTRTVTVNVTVPRFTDVQQVFGVCTSCHGGSGGLTLLTGSSYAALVDVNANNGACNTLKRVNPGDPSTSVLVRKIEGNTCGNRMPANNPTYFNNNPGLIIRIRSWILGGALND